MHESVTVQGNVGRLRGEIEHHPYRDVAHHLREDRHLHRRCGRARRTQNGRHAPAWQLASSPAWAFFRNYVLRRGFAARRRRPHDLARSTAYYTFLKLAKLRELAAGRHPVTDENPSRRHRPRMAGRAEPGLLTARGMAARGHAVRVACRVGRPRSRRASLAEALDHQSFAFGRGDLSPRSVAALAGVMRAYGPDVVQLHDPHGISAGVLAARLSRFDGALIGTRRVDFPLRGSLSRMKLSACDAVIAVSRAIVEILAESGLPRASTRLVYEGVADRPGGGHARRPAGARHRRPRLRGRQRRGADRPQGPRDAAGGGARLVAAEPSARVRGRSARASCAAQLEERASALGLGAAVVFAGFRPDVDRFIPHFDVFCLSSQKEGLGTSLLDAMCFSRPIVATAAGGIPEAVEDGVNGRLVPVKDPEKLAAGLIEVLRASPEQRKKWGAAGRERFLASFSVERMVDETLGVYDGALSTR